MLCNGSLVTTVHKRYANTATLSHAVCIVYLQLLPSKQKSLSPDCNKVSRYGDCLANFKMLHVSNTIMHCSMLHSICLQFISRSNY